MPDSAGGSGGDSLTAFPPRLQNWTSERTAELSSASKRFSPADTAGFATGWRLQISGITDTQLTTNRSPRRTGLGVQSVSTLGIMALEGKIRISASASGLVTVSIRSESRDKPTPNVLPWFAALGRHLWRGFVVGSGRNRIQREVGPCWEGGSCPVRSVPPARHKPGQSPQKASTVCREVTGTAG